MYHFTAQPPYHISYSFHGPVHPAPWPHTLYPATTRVLPVLGIRLRHRLAHVVQHGRVAVEHGQRAVPREERRDEGQGSWWKGRGCWLLLLLLLLVVVVVAPAYTSIHKYTHPRADMHASIHKLQAQSSKQTCTRPAYTNIHTSRHLCMSTHTEKASD